MIERDARGRFVSKKVASLKKKAEEYKTRIKKMEKETLEVNGEKFKFNLSENNIEYLMAIGIKSTKQLLANFNQFIFLIHIIECYALGKNDIEDLYGMDIKSTKQLLADLDRLYNRL